MDEVLYVVFDLNRLHTAAVSARWREGFVVATLALLIVVSGLLAWQNAALKEQLAFAVGGERTRSITAGDRLDPLEILAASGERRMLFSGAGPGPGRILLLIFNTSCPHCENTLPEWGRLAGFFADRGVEVLGVSLDDSGATAAYAARHGLRYPVASVLDRKYVASHRIDGVPATILADAGGTVMGVWTGEISPELFVEIARWASPGDKKRGL